MDAQIAFYRNTLPLLPFLIKAFVNNVKIQQKAVAKSRDRLALKPKNGYFLGVIFASGLTSGIRIVGLIQWVPPAFCPIIILLFKIVRQILTITSFINLKKKATVVRSIRRELAKLEVLWLNLGAVILFNFKGLPP